MLRTFAIFGSCVTRDAFEVRRPGTTSADKIALYLSRTTINSCLGDPVAHAEFAVPPAHAKFEERCVRSDLDKTHFQELRQKAFDYLLIDLIDERHSVLMIGKPRPVGRFRAHDWRRRRASTCRATSD